MTGIILHINIKKFENKLNKHVIILMMFRAKIYFLFNLFCYMSYYYRLHLYFRIFLLSLHIKQKQKKYKKLVNY